MLQPEPDVLDVTLETVAVVPAAWAYWYFTCWRNEEGISSIFNSEVLSYDAYMEKLSKHINMFIIDSLFFDVNYIKEVVNLFKDALNGTNIKQKLESLDNSIKFTDGFINKRIGLM